MDVLPSLRNRESGSEIKGWAISMTCAARIQVRQPRIELRLVFKNVLDMSHHHKLMFDSKDYLMQWVRAPRVENNTISLRSDQLHTLQVYKAL